MYNRYIPQPDGSYRRNQVSEQKHTQAQPDCETETQAPCLPDTAEIPCPCTPPREMGAGSFLKQLLPKNFDTADLIIVLLLLLLAGDCEEDRSNALLTLALYFIM